MKKIISFILISFTLISCEIKEELYIEKNGSGNVNYQVDFGKILAFTKGISDESDKKSPGLDKKIDTLIHFKDMYETLKDSIKTLSTKEQNILAEMKNYSVKMLIDAKKGNGMFSLMSDFKNVKDINNLQEVLDKARNFDKKTEKISSPKKYGFGYESNRKKFKRFVIQKKLTDEENKQYQSYVKNSGMLLSGSNYKVIYHFERKIKETTNKDAIISKDKKTIEISYPLDTLAVNPYLLEFEITFK